MFIYGVVQKFSHLGVSVQREEIPSIVITGEETQQGTLHHSIFYVIIKVEVR
jgi:hypothetical protein